MADDALDSALRPLASEAAKLALCLDFDGTLSPIIDDPEQAMPLPEVPELLERLARVCAAVALVSGRPAGYLADHVPAEGVRHLGLYGLEEIRDGELSVDPAAERERPAVRAALQQLQEADEVRSSGAFIEDKGLSVAIHSAASG